MSFKPAARRLFTAVSSLATRQPLFPSRNIINHRCLSIRNLQTSSSLLGSKGKVTVHFVFPDGKKTTVEAKEGTNLLDVVIDHDVDIDGFGACEGTLACSTCHLILPEDVYEKLPPPGDEEMDMLDLAYELTDTSRLGCQVVLTKEMDGLEVIVPAGLSDARS